MNLDTLDIKELRKKHKLNQQEFADALGITRELVGQMERGDKRISKATKILIQNFIEKNNKPINLAEEEEAAYKRSIENPADFLSHEVIQMKAMMRIILRSQAEILAERRSETVSKILSELSKAVADEISVSVSELKQGKG